MKLSLLLTIMTIMTSMLGAEGQRPDFAFPQEVIKQADSLIEQSHAMAPLAGDVAIITGATERVRATADIEPDSVYAVPAYLKSLESRCRTEVGVVLLNLLQAKAYCDIYARMRWTYDQREVPIDPLPDNVAEWSGEQLRRSINELLNGVLDGIDGNAFDLPLSTLEGCVSNYDTPAHVACDLRTFVLDQAEKIYQTIDDSEKVNATQEQGLRSCPRESYAWYYWKCKLLYGVYGSNDWQDYVKLYEDNADSIYATYVLQDGMIVSNMHITDLRRRWSALLEQAMERFPESPYYEAIKYYYEVANRPSVKFSYSDMTTPGRKFDVTIRYTNQEAIPVHIYQWVGGQKKLKEYKSMTVYPADPKGIEVDTVISVTIEHPGRYLISTNPDTGGQLLVCSDFVPILFNGNKTSYVATLDYTTGNAYGGVDVLYKEGRGQGRLIKLGKTGQSGLLRVVTEGYNHELSGLTFNYRGVSLDYSNYLWGGLRSTSQREEVGCTATIMTDRSLYKPGETVAWAAILNQGKHVVKGKEIVVEFRYPDRRLVSTVTCRTDSYGRVSGEFTVPEGELTGGYWLYVNCGNCIDASVVNVSEYKAPQFEVVSDGYLRDEPNKGDVTLIGRATTYTGMPVADAKVTVKVYQRILLWWNAGNRQIGEFEGVTDAEGNYKVVVPAENLSNADFCYAEIVVTSETGEAQRTSQLFGTGKPYRIMVENATDEMMVNTDNPVRLDVKALDGTGATASIAVAWRLVSKEGDNKKVVASGEAQTGNGPLELDFRAVSAGKYQFEVSPVDTTLADNPYPVNTLLYSVERKDMPADEIFFMPDPNITIEADAHGEAQIFVGVPRDGMTLVIAENLGTNELKVRTERYDRGFHYIKLVLPEGVDNGSVAIAAVHDGESKTIKREIIRRVNLNIEVTTFRDKLVPGTRETIGLRFTDVYDKPLEGAAVATIYNKALEAIQSMHWPMALHVGNFSWLDVQEPWQRMLENYMPTSQMTAKKPVSFQIPEWLYWFAGCRPLYIADECVAECDEVVYDLSAGASNDEAVGYSTSRSMASLDAPMKQAAVTDEDIEAEEAAAEFDYRMPDVMQALWQPQLVTDDNGEVEITFDVPNALATWVLRVFGWTDDAMGASAMATAKAVRPLMVQASLPRYLRQGDHAELMATIYNATDDAVQVQTTVEIFDTATGNVQHTYSFDNEIACGASAKVTVPVDAPVDAADVGYRVLSRTGNYADGEQTAIPVLASDAVTIDASTFYLNPGEGEYETTLPVAPEMHTVLQYCQNPIWTVVKAMRDISSSYSSATEAVHVLFGACVARTLNERYPAIGRAVELWHDNPSDSATVSMLERNGDLKQLTLEQTPWTVVAMNQTTRMSALANTFDKRVYRKAYNDALKKIVSMQTSEGGIQWCSWSNEPSLWATAEVIASVGTARMLGLIDSNDTKLNGMISKAISWYENTVLAQQHPQGDGLALITTFWPDAKLTQAGSRLAQKAIDDIAKNWKKYSAPQKALAALELNAHGRRDVALTILKSLRQFAVITPDQGMKFPSVSDARDYAEIVHAFAAIDPQPHEINAMRQWMIVQQQALSTFGVYSPDYVIAAIMLTGSDWTAETHDVTVTVGGMPMAPDRLEAATGYFSQPISPELGGQALRIAGHGQSPSYGSIVSIGRRLMTTIEPRPSRDVTVQKRLVVTRDGQPVDSNDSLQLGDRVSVLLTITTTRDLQYVTIVDERCAAMEPVDQLSGYVVSDGLFFYRENGDAETRLFVSYLPKGTYQISYDMTASLRGSFVAGPATVQSQYAPEITARSGGSIVTVK